MSQAATPPDGTEATVRGLVAAAGLKPSQHELATLIGAYPEFRARMDAMHALTEARYEVPSLVFDPDPTFIDWDAC